MENKSFADCLSEQILAQGYRLLSQAERHEVQARAIHLGHCYFGVAVHTPGSEMPEFIAFPASSFQKKFVYYDTAYTAAGILASSISNEIADLVWIEAVASGFDVSEVWYKLEVQTGGKRNA